MKSLLSLTVLFCFSGLLVSCATFDEEKAAQQVEDTSEFEDVVKIETIEEPEESADQGSPVEGKQSPATKKNSSKKATPKKNTSKKTTNSQQVSKDKKSPKPEKASTPPTKKNSAKKNSAKKNPAPKKQQKPEATASKEKDSKKGVKQAKTPRQPPLEDSEGFDGRRPIEQPYDVGETIVLGISYFGVEAGKFTMKVMPMVQVNGKKSYHFRYIIKTSPLFSVFYKVDDVAETFVDYETLLPHSYEIHVKESKQVRETRTYFDHKKLVATMWDNKKRPDKELEKKKIKWDLEAYSQNVFSAAYYLRNFTLKVGKELKVRVGHEGKNIEMTAKVIRRETIYTDAGKFDTFVVKPKFDIDGKFKPTGENYLWLTADDKKFIVRLESKIKIGSIVGEVQKLKP